MSLFERFTQTKSAFHFEVHFHDVTHLYEVASRDVAVSSSASTSETATVDTYFCSCERNSKRYRTKAVAPVPEQNGGTREDNNGAVAHDPFLPRRRHSSAASPVPGDSPLAPANQPKRSSLTFIPGKDGPVSLSPSSAAGLLPPPANLPPRPSPPVSGSPRRLEFDETLSFACTLYKSTSSVAAYSKKVFRFRLKCVDSTTSKWRRRIGRKVDLFADVNLAAFASKGVRHATLVFPLEGKPATAAGRLPPQLRCTITCVWINDHEKDEDGYSSCSSKQSRGGTSSGGGDFSRNRSSSLQQQERSQSHFSAYAHNAADARNYDFSSVPMAAAAASPPVHPPVHPHSRDHSRTSQPVAFYGPDGANVWDAQAGTGTIYDGFPQGHADVTHAASSGPPNGSPPLGPSNRAGPTTLLRARSTSHDAPHAVHANSQPHSPVLGRRDRSDSRESKEAECAAFSRHELHTTDEKKHVAASHSPLQRAHSQYLDPPTRPHAYSAPPATTNSHSSPRPTSIPPSDNIYVELAASDLLPLPPRGDRSHSVDRPQSILASFRHPPPSAASVVSAVPRRPSVIQEEPMMHRVSAISTHPLMAGVDLHANRIGGTRHQQQMNDANYSHRQMKHTHPAPPHGVTLGDPPSSSSSLLSSSSSGGDDWFSSIRDQLAAVPIAIGSTPEVNKSIPESRDRAHSSSAHQNHDDAYGSVFLPETRARTVSTPAGSEPECSSLPSTCPFLDARQISMSSTSASRPLSPPFCSPASASGIQQIVSIHFSAFSNLRRFHEGHFGVIYRAEMTTMSHTVPSTHVVAIKVPRRRPGPEEIAELFSCLHLPTHPHVLPLIGVCTDWRAPVEDAHAPHATMRPAEKMFCLVTELQQCNLQELATQLPAWQPQLQPHDANITNASPPMPTKDPPLLLRLLHQMALGVAHLHEHRHVHRDIALRNFLLSHDNRVLLCDFGLSQALGDGANNGAAFAGLTSPSSALPLRWLAPETILAHRFSTASDVWSFGVSSWELITQSPPDRPPYHEITDAREIAAHICTGEGQLRCEARCTRELEESGEHRTHTHMHAPNMQACHHILTFASVCLLFFSAPFLQSGPPLPLSHAVAPTRHAHRRAQPRTHRATTAWQPRECSRDDHPQPLSAMGAAHATRSEAHAVSQLLSDVPLPFHRS